MPIYIAATHPLRGRGGRRRFLRKIILLSLFAVLALFTILAVRTRHQMTANQTQLGVLAREADAKIPEGRPQINLKLLYGVYSQVFQKRTDFLNTINAKGKLVSCFYTTQGTEYKAIESPDIIFANVQNQFGCSIGQEARQNILSWAENLPDGYSDPHMITNALVSSRQPAAALGQTEQKTEDGQEGSEKNNIGLVNYAYGMLDCKSAYIYGAFGQPVTLDFLVRQQNTFKNDGEAELTDDVVVNTLANYAGHPAFDCIGLIKSYGWLNEESGSFAYNSNGMPDVGANSIMRVDGLTWGDISTMPETPGLAVQMDGHIGIYAGNGEVIEAKGNRYGVVKTRLKGRGWLHWLKIPSITYVQAGTYSIHNDTVQIAEGQVQRYGNSN